jgi:hypothetical protein
VADPVRRLHLLTSDLGIVYGLPVPGRTPRPNRLRDQMKACALGGCFWTDAKMNTIYCRASKLGKRVKLRLEDAGYRVWVVG